MAYSSNQFAPLRTAIVAEEAIGVLPHRAIPRDLIRVGPEAGLPELPHANLILKVGARAGDDVHKLASAIALAFRPLAAAAATPMAAAAAPQR